MYRRIQMSAAALTDSARNAKCGPTAKRVIPSNAPAPPIVVVAIAAATLAASCGSSQTSTSTSSPQPAGGKITAHFTETLTPQNITNGGVAGTGRFSITGAAIDNGNVTDYRTVKGNTALIRRVAVGKKGTITFLITINLSTGSEPWTITSATKSYEGLHGAGTESVDNYDDSPATFALEGTVSQ